MSGAPNENLSDNCRKKGRDAKSEVVNAHRANKISCRCTSVF